jgi:hypothetical protein
MHLKQVRAKNFRAFGDGKTAAQLDWKAQSGARPESAGALAVRLCW